MFFIQQYIFEKKKKHIYKLHIIPDVPLFYSNDTQTRQRNHNDVAMNPNERPK